MASQPTMKSQRGVGRWSVAKRLSSLHFVLDWQKFTRGGVDMAGILQDLNKTIIAGGLAFQWRIHDGLAWYNSVHETATFDASTED